VITVAKLVASGIAPTQARMFAEPMSRACERFHINTADRIAAFIGQCRIESANFTRLEESLFYTTPARIRAVFPSRVRSDAQAATLVRSPEKLANTVYAGRLGNGDQDSGDGWRFIGRGLIHLTGRTNYTSAAAALHRPYITQSTLVGMPEDACLTAAWFWHRNGLNAMADNRAWEQITRAVNGPAMLHARERVAATRQALPAFA